MKRVLLFILLTAITATAQLQRYDNFAATTASASGIGNITQVIANATITVFNQPAVGVSCAGGGCVAATTFTSRTGGTPCGGGLPLTRPTSNTCLATADLQGNFGFWAAAGAYQYCVAATNFTTTCYNVILGATLDGTNTFTGQINCKSLVGPTVKCVDGANTMGWTGSDLGAWINAADSAIGTNQVAGEIWVVGTTVANTASTQISINDTHVLKILSPITISSPILIGQYSKLTCSTNGGATGSGNGYINAGGTMASMLRERNQATEETFYLEHCLFNGGGFTFSRGVIDLTGINDVGYVGDIIITNYGGSSPGLYLDDCPNATCGSGNGSGHSVIGPVWITPQANTATGVLIKHTNTAGSTPLGPIHFQWLEVQTVGATLGGASGWVTIQNLCAGTCTGTQQLSVNSMQFDHLEVDTFGAVDGVRFDGCEGCVIHNLFSVGATGTLFHQTNSTNNYANKIDQISTLSTGTVIQDDITGGVTVPATQADGSFTWTGAPQTTNVALNVWDYRPILGFMVGRASFPAAPSVSDLGATWSDSTNHCVGTWQNGSVGPEFCPNGTVSLGAIGGVFRFDSSGTVGFPFRAINSGNGLSGMQMTTFQAMGNQPTLTGTGACATTTTQVGGTGAGNFTCTGVTGASTVTLTFGSTAAHWYACFGSDTTHTLAGSQSGTASTTACTLTFTSVTANDILTFGAIAF